MDEGFITSTNGKKADARNCLILMTSNLGAKELKNMVWDLVQTVQMIMQVWKQ